MDLCLPNPILIPSNTLKRASSSTLLPSQSTTRELQPRGMNPRLHEWKTDVLISLPDLFSLDSLEQSTLSQEELEHGHLFRWSPQFSCSLHISSGSLLIPLRFQLPWQRLFPMVFFKVYFIFFILFMCVCLRSCAHKCSLLFWSECNGFLAGFLTGRFGNGE